MNRLSIIASAAILAAAPLSAEEVLSGTISISRATTTANRTAKPVNLKKVPSKTDIITAKEIKERGYKSIVEAISNLPGVSTENSPGNIPAVYMRGMGGSDVLLVIDGEPIVDYTSPSPSMINAIDINSVEKIEILKGAQSGVWGSNAVAGVINIVTKKARKDYAAISIGTGSYGTRNWGFETSQKGKHGSIFVSHNEESSDGFSATGKKGDEADGHHAQDTHIKASITNGVDTISAYWHDYSSDYSFDGTVYGKAPTYTPAPKPNDTTSVGNKHLVSQGASYHYDKNNIFADAKISLTTIKRGIKQNLGSPTRSRYRGSKLTAIASLGYRDDQQTLRVGGERSTYSAISDKSAYTPPTNDSFRNDAIFANYTYTFDDLLGAQTTINAALRYDHFDKFADKGTYRLGIRRNCDILPGLHTSANIYSAYKVPSLYQYTNARGTLKPEYTMGYDINLGYKNLINISYFKNKTTDKFISINDKTASNQHWYYSNSNTESNVSGIEVSGGYDLGTTGIYLGANFTHLFQDHLVRRAQNSANIFADYHWNTDTTLNLTAHYEGARDAFDGTRLSSYKTLNASVNTKIAHHLDLSFGIKNILNANYETAKGYNTAGRSIYARIKYTF